MLLRPGTAFNALVFVKSESRRCMLKVTHYKDALGQGNEITLTLCLADIDHFTPEKLDETRGAK